MSKGPDWIYSTNIYEVNLRQYTQEGTINAIGKHLPRLKDMGIETLWFMPITPISHKNRKGSLGSYYACSDYTAVSSEFGTLEDWKGLVKEAHGMGFKVILDWVANHTGWDHRWTVEHPEWYRKDEHTGDFKKASGMDDIIELDFDKPEVVNAMIAAMKWWIDETGIDGFRCDLAFWVKLDFWKVAKKELEQVKPLFWLGELDILDNPEYMEVFNAAYTWKWMHKAEHFYKQRLPLAELLDVLNQYTSHPGIKAWFTANHDENTWNGTEYEKYGSMAGLLAVFSATWKGIPLIYTGQELPNHKRLKFFEKDAISWKDETELHQFYKTLLGLHSNNKALRADADCHVLGSNAQDRVLAFKRQESGQEVVVLLNFSDQPIVVDVEQIHGSYTEIFTAEKRIFEGNGSFHLKEWGWNVLAK
jgi:glycosidase